MICARTASCAGRTRWRRASARSSPSTTTSSIRPTTARTLESHVGRTRRPSGGRRPRGDPAARPSTSYVARHRRSCTVGAALERSHRRSTCSGPDSVAFRTSTLRVDVREWPNVNMVDLSLRARARATRSVPLVSGPARRRGGCSALAERPGGQHLARRLARTTRVQTALAQELLALPRCRGLPAVLA